MVGSDDTGATPAAGRASRSAALVARHRHGLVNVLIEGGAGEARAECARDFHAASLMRTGPFVAVDARIDAIPLRAALLRWAGVASPGEPSTALRACERGTLFIDHVDSADAAVQRLLHAVASRAPRAEAPGPARLIVGSASPLGDAVARGQFLRALHDSLDKVHVALDAEPEAA